jgi:hypothetical protein
MSDFREGRAEFLDVYPARTALLDGLPTLENDEALLVDVGGGQGHEAIKFNKAFPQVKGRLIVQDQQGMLGASETSQKVEFIEHDFFTPQPVKGKPTIPSLLEIIMPLLITRQTQGPTTSA